MPEEFQKYFSGLLTIIKKFWKYGFAIFTYLPTLLKISQLGALGFCAGLSVFLPVLVGLVQTERLNKQIEELTKLEKDFREQLDIIQKEIEEIKQKIPYLNPNDTIEAMQLQTQLSGINKKLQSISMIMEVSLNKAKKV